MNEFRDKVESEIVALHDEATDLLAELDRGGRFREDPWERLGGGGGVTRVLSHGVTFEKVGVNRATVYGRLGEDLIERLGGRSTGDREADFFATGLSLVAHPRSPMVPTVHLNVRYFELRGARGEPKDAWFGGGTDLTPTYPFVEDAVHFHRELKRVCERYGPDLYPRFKEWCDRYFVNTHRGGERRGIGGIFFDNLRPVESGLDREALARFVAEVGRSLGAAYRPIVERRRGTLYGERERRFQLARRGRYVEFNLVYDRGTVFGLQTQARVESVLMSLPPLAAWEYAPDYEPGSFEAELLAMLEPREWA